MSCPARRRAELRSTLGNRLDDSRIMARQHGTGHFRTESRQSSLEKYCIVKHRQSESVFAQRPATEKTDICRCVLSLESCFTRPPARNCPVL
jgi:hypothetical protein